MIYLRVHVVKPTFCHVEVVTLGLHYSSAPLGLPFLASEGRRRCATSNHFCQGPRFFCRMSFSTDTLLLLGTCLSGFPSLSEALSFIMHIFTYPLSKLVGQELQRLVELTICVLEPHSIRHSWAFTSVACYH